MQERRDIHARRTPTRWVGWVMFAGTMAIIVGVFTVMQGLAALFNDEYFVVGQGELLLLDFTTWGWIHLVVGLILVLIGIGMLRGSPWGLVAGVVIAGAGAILQLGFLAAYPVWSILIIALHVVIIYALIVHGQEMAS
jgi:hypothetical protein